MPIYEYACPDCGHKFEALQKFSDDPITTCPQCQQVKVKKLISATNFVLKGGGWYSDHYGLKGGDKTAEGAGDKAGDKPAGDAAAPAAAGAAPAAAGATPAASPAASPAAPAPAAAPAKSAPASSGSTT